MQIEIDFDVFKALTALRETEQVSYNDVLRTLLKLPAVVKSEVKSCDPLGGYVAAGRFLPDGTDLRVRYKGVPYAARIDKGRVLHASGAMNSSLSAAAKRITENNVNGLRFWEAKRPSDSSWSKVVELPKDVL